MDLLSIKQNVKLLEKYRHFNVDTIDWWDDVFEMFTEDMKEKGIAVDRMFFSGFCSQGDGACFEGEIDDIERFFTHNFKYTDYPLIQALIRHGGTVSMKCVHRGHYYHENCTVFSMDSDCFYNLWQQPDELRQHVVRALDDGLGYELVHFEEDVVSIFRNYMRELYKRLEDEYDSLVSDDAVAEAILEYELYEETDDDGDT